MLEILINGQSVDYNDDIIFNLSLENPFMSADKIPLPFSTSIELPMSSNNILEFGFPQRLNNEHIYLTKDRQCEILFDGIKVFDGIFIIDEIGDTIQGNLQGGNGADILEQNLSNLKLDKFIVGDYAYKGWKTGNEGAIIPNESDTGNVNTNVLYGQIDKVIQTQSTNFIVAPIRYTSVKYEQNGTLGFYFKNLRSMYINPGWGAYTKPITTTGSIVRMGTILPAIKLCHIIDSIQGVVENPFSNGEFTKVVMQSISHPSITDDVLGVPVLDVENTSGTDMITVLNLASFLPSQVTIADFLKEVFKIFCCSLFVEHGVLKIMFNRDIFRDQSFIDLSDKDFKIISVSCDKKASYKYGYSDVADKEPKAFDKSVNSVADIFMSTGVGLDQTFEIVTENNKQYIERKKEPIKPQEWVYNVKDGGFGASNEDPYSKIETFDTSSTISPLKNAIHNVWEERNDYADAMPQWPTENGAAKYEALYVPELEKLGDVTTMPKIMLNQNWATGLTRGNAYRFLTAKNYDHNGNRLGNLSLDWDGEDGLINNYHKEFMTWIGRDRRCIQIEIVLDPLSLSNLSLKKKIFILSKLFYIKKWSVNFHKDYIEYCTLDLIEV